MYKVSLDHFEGPLDLLLFFIRRDEVNIYDIPIARITNEFLEYVHYIRQLDLEVASDFIYMATYLLSIKARMLLPAEPGEDGEIEDPRTELMTMLLEHSQFKEAAADLLKLENERSVFFQRLQFDAEKKMAESNTDPGLDILLENVTLFDLMLVYRKVIQNTPKVTYHEVKKISVTIEDQIKVVGEWLDRKERFAFSELFKEIQEKIVLIITFLAILEMTKLQKITLFISENLTDFYVVRRTETDEDVNGELSNYGG
ncbi:MAG: segregation/condensation protein A [Bacteroidetes bacterium]|nr:segregation/condensation protein A [Bacteroidota bacterium]